MKQHLFLINNLLLVWWTCWNHVVVTGSVHTAYYSCASTASSATLPMGATTTTTMTMTASSLPVVASHSGTTMMSATSSPPPVAVAAAVVNPKGGNMITGLVGAIKNSIVRTIDGCQELWANYGTCNDIRAKIKVYQAARQDEWIQQGLYNDRNSKQLKQRLQRTIGGITFEEYAFLQKGKEDRSKLMSLAFIVAGAPRFLPYALMFQPEMLPKPLRPPPPHRSAAKDGGETHWQQTSRERAKVMLQTLLQLESAARDVSWTAKMSNIFGRGQQVLRRQQQQQAWNAQIEHFLRNVGTASRQGARTVVQQLEPWLYPSGGNLERSEQRLSQVPLALTKGLGDALLGGGFLNNLSPSFLQRGRLVGHLKQVAEADAFLVDTHVDLATIPPELLRETCSARLIGNAGMTSTQLQVALADWLMLVEQEPRERLQQQSSSSSPSNGLQYNGNLARTALLTYYALQGMQDEGCSCRLPRALYQGYQPAVVESSSSSLSSSSSSPLITEDATSSSSSSLPETPAKAGRFSRFRKR